MTTKTWVKALAKVLAALALLPALAGCPPDSGAGGTNQQPAATGHPKPAAKPTHHPWNDKSYYQHKLPKGQDEYAFVVEWDPDERPVDITWKIGNKKGGPITLYRQPFIKDFTAHDSDYIEITAKQHEQGWLRCAVDSSRGEVDHQVTTEYQGSVTCKRRAISQM